MTPPDGPTTFELTNSGLSDACDVVLVISDSMLGEVERFDIGVAVPGQTITVRPATGMAVQSLARSVGRPGTSSTG